MPPYSLKVTPADHQNQAQFQQKLTLGANFFRQNGFLYIDDVIPPERADAICEHLERGLHYNSDKTELVNAKAVGNKRYMLPIKIEDKFNDPSVYANPVLLMLMSRLLGPAFVIDSFGAVVALPGSEAQNIHRDSPLIFGEDPFLGASLPPYAITVTMPLVDITLKNGPTKLHAGSHKLPKGQQPLPDTEQVIPAKRGSLVIWDYRILHGGSPNLSRHIRPMLYFVYSRPWFQDHVNFSKDIRPVDMDEHTFNALPVEYQKLFRSSISTHW